MKRPVSERDATPARIGEHVADGATIRERQRRHLRGDSGRCTRTASEFDYEASVDAIALYRHYICYLATTDGLLSDCNEDAGR